MRPNGCASDTLRSGSRGPQVTLSGSAWNLREEIRNIADTVDIGVGVPVRNADGAQSGLHTRYRGGRFTTSWCSSKVTDEYVSNSLRRGEQVGGLRMAGSTPCLWWILSLLLRSRFSSTTIVAWMR